MKIQQKRDACQGDICDSRVSTPNDYLSFQEEQTEGGWKSIQSDTEIWEAI